MSETPVGERPATGGRVKQFATAAERARTWREGQKQRREAGEASPRPASAILAPAALGATLEVLRGLFSGQQEALEGQVRRIEEAIEALTDPEAIEEAIEEARADAARQVAEADDRAAKARRAAAEADAQLRVARDDLESATEAATVAWERVEALEAEVAAGAEQIVGLGQALSDAEEAHAQALAAEGEAHRLEIDALRTELNEAHHAEAEALRTDRAEAEARAARATGAETAAVEQVARLRDELEGTRTAARTEVARLVAELARIETAGAAALEDARARRDEAVEGLRARHDGELAGERARAQALSELAEARRAEADHLRLEIEQLRSELGERRRAVRTSKSGPVTKEPGQ